MQASSERVPPPAQQRSTIPGTAPAISPISTLLPLSQQQPTATQRAIIHLFNNHLSRSSIFALQILRSQIDLVPYLSALSSHQEIRDPAHTFISHLLNIILTHRLCNRRQDNGSSLFLTNNQRICTNRRSIHGFVTNTKET